MGRVYPVGNRQQTIKQVRVNPGVQAPPAQMPQHKPYTIDTKTYPVGHPVNDNGNRVPPKRGGMVIRNPVGAMIGLTRGMIIADAIGIVPGQQPVAFPAVFLGVGGRYSFCPNPSGFGGPFNSNQSYFPGSTAVQIVTPACAALQALPGGTDGMPDPYDPAVASAVGVWRYSNTAMTRYSHLWSLKNGARQWVMPEVLPSIRQASAVVPTAPPPPKTPAKGREKKFILNSRALSFVTEVGDVVDCLFSGLPGGQKAAAYNAAGGRLGKAKKAVAAYDGWHDINWAKVATCMAGNAIEDWGYGNLGRVTGRANRLRGNLAGLTVGPAL